MNPRKSPLFIFRTALFVILLANAALAGGQIIYRDLDTGIRSDATRFISPRYMRHLCITEDGAGLAIVQKGGFDGDYLVLYKTLDQGLTWTYEANISDNNEAPLVGDGILDADNNLLITVSFLREYFIADVEFFKFVYTPQTRTWTLDPAGPVTVHKSIDTSRASRASLAMDSNGVLWCAFRQQEKNPKSFFLKVYYSTDGGLTWMDSLQEFGTKNALVEKSPKVLAVGSRIALIYHDEEYAGSSVERYKRWAFRDDAQGAEDGWTRGTIVKMGPDENDEWGAHWSVAGDQLGNLHLAYQDDAIYYTRYDAGTGAWSSPDRMADGFYPAVSTSSDNQVVLFQSHGYQDGAVIIGRKLNPSTMKWSSWHIISSQVYHGNLRLCSPEKFDHHLPLLYMVSPNPPFPLVYNLLYLP